MSLRFIILAALVAVVVADVADFENPIQLYENAVQSYQHVDDEKRVSREIASRAAQIYDAAVNLVNVIFAGDGGGDHGSRGGIMGFFDELAGKAMNSWGLERSTHKFEEMTLSDKIACIKKIKQIVEILKE